MEDSMEIRDIERELDQLWGFTLRLEYELEAVVHQE